MGGVDKFDQLCSTYPFERKCMKWYKVLWHFLIEAVLVNSRICYNLVPPTKMLGPKVFREKIIDGLLSGHAKMKLWSMKSHFLAGEPGSSMRTSDPSARADQMSAWRNRVWRLERTVKRGRRSRKSVSVQKNMPEGQHYLRHHEEGHRPNCVVCSIMPAQWKKKGKGECKRKQTRYYCNVCPEKPSMCVVPCFENYHVNLRFRKVCECE